jgi:protein-S-isoprenylcysteine O-methyltransferase Ste14
MVRLGNFLFHYRNGLFPVAYLLFLCPSPRIFSDDTLAVALGLVLALNGQLLRALTIGLAYIVRGGRKRRVYAELLVQEGIFAHCRNPLYLGNFLIIIGLGLVDNSLFFILIGAPLFFIAYLAIIAAEENYLRQKFGQAFDDYCACVNRFIPNFAGLKETLRSMEFKWRRLIVQEYGSAYAWMAGAILLVLKNQWLDQGRPKVTPVIWILFGLLAMVTLLYAVARYLKKSQLLRAD